MPDPKQESNSIFACDMSALTREQRESHGVVSTALFAKVDAVRDMVNGCAFRLPPDSITLQQVLDFVSLERLCCPFFTFTVEVEAYNGPVWLELSGADGVKAMVAMELGGFLRDEVARAAGLTPDST